VDEIDWISDNQIKGISEDPSCTIHASDEYSQKFWDAPDSERIPQLLSVAEDRLGVKITSWVSHRWGFAKPVVTFGASHWHSFERNLTLAGDGFGGERIENAALSGWDAADSIIL
jgi:predicted NAD/FAD-dependent oxidoreductase